VKPPVTGVPVGGDDPVAHQVRTLGKLCSQRDQHAAVNGLIVLVDRLVKTRSRLAHHWDLVSPRLGGALSDSRPPAVSLRQIRVAEIRSLDAAISAREYTAASEISLVWQWSSPRRRARLDLRVFVD
jgi:hypothetical protein